MGLFRVECGDVFRALLVSWKLIDLRWHKYVERILWISFIRTHQSLLPRYCVGIDHMVDRSSYTLSMSDPTVVRYFRCNSSCRNQTPWLRPGTLFLRMKTTCPTCQTLFSLRKPACPFYQRSFFLHILDPFGQTSCHPHARMTSGTKVVLSYHPIVGVGSDHRRLPYPSVHRCTTVLRTWTVCSCQMMWLLLASTKIDTSASQSHTSPVGEALRRFCLPCRFLDPASRTWLSVPCRMVFGHFVPSSHLS